MKCSEIRKKLSALLDGEVTGEEKRLISEHVKSCEFCQKEFEALSQVSEVLEVMDEVHVSPFFLTRLKQKIADQKVKAGIRFPFMEWIRRVTIPIAATVLIIMSFVVGSNLGKMMHQKRAEIMAKSDAEIANTLGVSSLGEFPEGSLGWAYNNVLIGGE
jgi:predicted anti-sigma-YlaC factor YlaD